LRATGNRGLQPAMDFILEHTDDPIPDASAQGPAASSAVSQNDPMDEDDDDAAVRAAYGKASVNVAADAPDAEARVCANSLSICAD